MDSFGTKSVSGGNEESQGSSSTGLFDTSAYLANTRQTAEEIAQIQEHVLQERSRVDQEIFDNRNAANQEWMRLHEEGASVRQDDFQQTLKALGETEERKEEFIRQQEKEIARLKEESTRKRLELEKEAQRQNEATERSTAKAIDEIKDKERQEEKKVRKQLQAKEKEAQKEIRSISKHYEEEIGEAVLNQRNAIEKMKADFERRMEEEKRKREQIAREKASFFSWGRNAKPAAYKRGKETGGRGDQFGTSSGHSGVQSYEYEPISGNAAAPEGSRGELPDDESSRSSSKVINIIAIGLLLTFVIGFSIYKYTKSESE